ncbi:MAG: sulfatase [Cytophagales bacterium]|nr:sulfatase [Cytophagales bacterium]
MINLTIDMNPRDSKASILLFLALVPFLLSAEIGKEQAPNIIFILADDLGYSDVGYINQKPKVQTPNIDELAKSGMIFTNAYTASPVCSPTRASIMTGKYPATLQLTCHIPGIGMQPYLDRMNKKKQLMEAEFVDRLPLEETTFAEVLKENGYKTAFMGKWHLAGEGSQKTTDGVVDAMFHPDRQGFDINIGGCAYGQPASYFSPYKNATIAHGAEKEYLTDRLGTEACNFIEKNRNKPFLLCLWTYTVHTPLRAPQEIIEKYNGNKYLAMIDKLDENVGKLLEKVNELGLKDNTLIILYSDNGGLFENPPLNNHKGSLYEGGIRVPLIMSYPGKILAGSTCDVPVTSPDFFPTILETAGILSKKYENLEGKNLWPLLFQKDGFEERAIFWHFPHHRNTEKAMGAAVRAGKWKLIWEYESDKLSLFNLEEDVGETKNLANINPQKLKGLHKKLKTWLIKTNAAMPQPNPNYKESKN